MDQILNALKATGEETRLRLIHILAHGELTVTELTHVLGQSQPRVSRHLKLLSEAGLVTRFPEGSWVLYRLVDSGPLHEYLQSLLRLLPADDPVTQRDIDRLRQVHAVRAERAQKYFSNNAANWENLRRMHIGDDHIEKAMLKLIGDQRIDLLVDLGTGGGRILEVFGPRAKKAIGFDINADMLALARTRLENPDLSHCQVRQGDVTSLPLPSGEADVVIMHQVLHFLDEPVSAIREAGRILHAGGILLIADFAPHDKEVLRDEHAHRRLGFPTNEISKIIEESGLEIITTNTLSRSRKWGKESADGLTVNLWSARQLIQHPQQKKLKSLS